MSRARVGAVVIAALSVAALSGCGDDSDSAADSTTSTPSNATPQLAGVIADATRMAPALESKLRGTTYPTTLDGALKALTDSGIEPSAGNVVKGYRYEPDAVEFVLCIEGPSGAFAAYDTKPMSVFQTGESGGCPAS